jgi:perosamine synthetase
MIPIFWPSCSDLEVRYVTEVLRSGRWGIGPKTEELEEKFAQRIGVQHAVATSSCTAALQLTIQALDISGDDAPHAIQPEIIMPALTFASTALAAVHNGARPIFADVNEQTLCIDWKDAKTQVSMETRAVIPVWYGGTVVQPFQSGAWNNIPFIEDCAHAAGSSLAGKIGIAACWSFHAVKNLAAGDGGMMTTDDAELAARVRKLRWCGIDRSTWDRDKGSSYSWQYDISEPGWKAHMNDITAALALAQLERLDDLNKARYNIVRQYLDELAGIEWLQLPEWRDDSSWHLFVIRVAADDRDRFIDHMKSHGITTGVHYKPLNTFKAFRVQEPVTVFDNQELPVTDRVWKTLVTLPLYPGMTESDVSCVISAVKSFR